MGQSSREWYHCSCLVIGHIAASKNLSICEAQFSTYSECQKRRQKDAINYKIELVHVPRVSITRNEFDQFGGVMVIRDPEVVGFKPIPDFLPDSRIPEYWFGLQWKKHHIRHQFSDANGSGNRSSSSSSEDNAVGDNSNSSGEAAVKPTPMLMAMTVAAMAAIATAYQVYSFLILRSQL